jgi:hypothetical protein
MNYLTIIAGIASVVSLIFHLSGKGPNVRQFTLPITGVIVGFAIGRNNSDVGQGANLLLQDPYLLLMLIIMVMFFGLAMYMVEQSKAEAKVSLIFLVFLSTIVIPQLVKSYNEISPTIATQDYLTLARAKENSGYIEDAIKYLNIYSKRVNRVDVQRQVSSKINNLRSKQFKQDFVPSKKSKGGVPQE